MNTNSQSGTNHYTEARAKQVMGKIYDDFHAIELRGFKFFIERPFELHRWKEDIHFLMTEQVLDTFQVQFLGTNDDWAVEFAIKSDGSIVRDDDSGGIDYWEIPNDVQVNLVAKWKRGDARIDNHMAARGWIDGATYVQGDLINDGAYSKDGYGATKGRRGAWKH